jgi:hypothetical protein
LSDLGTCAGCGLEIAGGTEGCQALFDQFRLRESAELARGYGSTRLTIDIYSVQHPDRYCVSAKSLAAHLTGLCWAVERGGSEAGLRALQRWLNGSVPLNKPDVPKGRGKLTVADIAGAAETTAYEAALDRWARSTWEAYSPLHAVARRWIDEAVPQSG